MVVEWLDIPGQSEFYVRQGHGVSLGFLAFDPGWTRTPLINTLAIDDRSVGEPGELDTS